MSWITIAANINYNHSMLYCNKNKVSLHELTRSTISSQHHDTLFNLSITSFLSWGGVLKYCNCSVEYLSTGLPTSLNFASCQFPLKCSKTSIFCSSFRMSGCSAEVRSSQVIWGRMRTPLRANHPPYFGWTATGYILWNVLSTGKSKALLSRFD